MTALLTSLRALRAAPIATPWTLSTRKFAHSRPAFQSTASPILDGLRSRVAVTPRSLHFRSARTGVLASIATVGLGLSIFSREPVSCDSASRWFVVLVELDRLISGPATPPPPSHLRESLPPPPAS